MKLQAVFFDLDKTLWTFTDQDGRKKIYAAQGQKLLKMLEEHGVKSPWDAAFIGSVVGNGIWAAERTEYYSTGIPPDYSAVLEKILTFWFDDLPALDYDELYRGLYVREAPFKSIYPDVLPALEKLKEMGLKMGVISNRTMGGRPFLEEWAETPLANYIDDIIISCDVGYMKPHPEIFRIAMEKIGVEPGRSMMVGDLLRADVIGARWAGMTSVWINRDGQPNEYPSVRPDYEIKNFDELIEIVENEGL